MAMTPPSLTELVDAVDLADPTALHKTRNFVVKQLAAQLRPELEALVKQNDSHPGEPYVFNAQACAKRCALLLLLLSSMTRGLEGGGCVWGWWLGWLVACSGMEKSCASSICNLSGVGCG